MKGPGRDRVWQVPMASEGSARKGEGCGVGERLVQGDALEVTISGINSRGEGIARTDEGFVLFVPQGLPGERVVVAVTEAKRQYATGRIQRLVEPHSRRVTPRCPWYGSCGGCQLQHADPILQREMKGDLVRDALTRLGKTAPEGDFSSCEESPSLWGYRNKAVFPAAPHPGGGARLGFYREGSHRLVPVRSCAVIEPRLDRLFGVLGPLLEKGPLVGYDERRHSGDLRHVVLRAGVRTDHVACILVMRENPSERQRRWLLDRVLPAVRSSARRHTLAVHVHGAPGNTIWGGHTEILAGERFLSERMGDFSFSYDVTSFFQVNPPQAERLFDRVAETVRSRRAARVLELYAGVGSLTAFLARLGGEVTAVESWVASVESARHNTGRPGYRNVRTVCADVGTFLEGTSPGWDVVVLDPPRSGCEDAVLERLSALAPDAMVYVSCNPATLARDVGTLEARGYRLESAVPFDLFPQTSHVETLAVLRRQEGESGSKKSSAVVE